MQKKKHKSFQEYLAGKEVEIVPWAHSIEESHHVQVVNYIKHLPRNSFLALELTSKALSKYLSALNSRKLLEQLLQGKTFPRVPAPVNSAFLDVILECAKRDISLVPIESSVRYKLSRRLRRRRYMTEFEKLAVRDSAMSELSVTALKNKKIKKLYLVTGTGHVAGIQYNLSKADVKCKIKTDIFSHKDSISEQIDIFMRGVNALNRGDKVALDRLHVEFLNSLRELDFPARAFSDKQLIHDLKYKILSRIRAQEKHIKRKTSRKTQIRRVAKRKLI
ncbi:hypothetical protein KKG83_01315 [Candidatus Micrarchaeota archaeon]|nr:hypothetical protein [Candidatus Micrarchaeota archaeon]MBU2476088.1 hypothetical protein [Candidatus Micrarchaeota archaeon]